MTARTRGRVILDLSADDAEFMAEAVKHYSPRDQSAAEIQALADRAREELADDEGRPRLTLGVTLR